MNTQVAQAENIVKSKLLRAFVGGFVGTVLFTLMGMFVAPKVIGQPMDVAALIAPVLGGSYTAGVIAHFVTGTILFPIAYLVPKFLFTRLRGTAGCRTGEFHGARG
jgi:hypothetical protein